MTMMELDPCIACRRHIAVTETACPFCGVLLPARTAQAFAPNRLSRAAVFVAGIALAGAVGCGGSKKDVKTQPTTSDAGISNDADPAANEEAHRRALDEQERHQHHGGGGCSGQPPVCMPYGAPPARRRLV